MKIVFQDILNIIQIFSLVVILQEFHILTSPHISLFHVQLFYKSDKNPSNFTTQVPII